MWIDRRNLMIGAGALAMFPRPAFAAKGDWFERAIVIDGLGNIGDPEAGDGVSRYTDQTWADTLATGVTVVRDTVFPVGNGESAWADYEESIADKRAIFGANPERMIQIRCAPSELLVKTMRSDERSGAYKPPIPPVRRRSPRPRRFMEYTSKFPVWRETK